MNLWVAKIDTTEYWREDIQKAAGRIFSCYVFDREAETHCCELAASYELWFIDYQTEFEVDERMYNEIQEAMTTEEVVIYQHCRDIDAGVQLRKGQFFPNKSKAVALRRLGKLPVSVENDGRNLIECADYLRSNSAY